MPADSQQQAVLSHRNGPLVVTAGPGSGKTATIIGRTGQMLREGYRPEELLLLTFSRKACSEMRDRLGKWCELNGLPLDIAARTVIETFHSFGLKFLRNCSAHTGFENPITLLDEGDANKLIKSIYGPFVPMFPDMELSEVRDALHDMHQQGIGQGTSTAEQKRWLARQMRSSEIAESLLLLDAEYGRLKKQQSVVDYDDLLLLPVRLVEKHPELGEALASQFADVTVDEAQDTNLAQFQMVQVIAPHNRVVMVGDDDQLIYEWRGARMDNLYDFIRDSGATVMKLENNYRSASAIVSAAASLITQNTRRLDKTPRATKETTGHLGCKQTPDSRMLIAKMIHEIQQQVRTGSPDEVAILYRTNRLSRMIEPALIDAGLPYQVVGGVKLTDRVEVKQAMAIARLVSNFFDFTAWLRVSEVIRGLGETGVKHLHQSLLASKGNLDVFDYAVPKRAKEDMVALLELIVGLSESGPRQWLPETLGAFGLLTRMGIKDAKDIEAREGALMQLHEWIERRLDQAEARQGSPLSNEAAWQIVQEFLVSEDDAHPGEAGITLSTIHRSKGREWSHVHVFGASEPFLPSGKKIDDEADDLSVGTGNIEEERRLCYVAVTRAKQSCTLWHASRYDMGYETQQAKPSRFIAELGLSLGAPPACRPDQRSMGRF